VRYLVEGHVQPIFVPQAAVEKGITIKVKAQCQIVEAASKITCGAAGLRPKRFIRQLNPRGELQLNASGDWGIGSLLLIIY